MIGSPSTSEIIRLTTRPARQARNSPPPLIRLNCFRTVFNSVMSAPAAARCRVTPNLSANVISGTGAGNSAEPPPEIRQMHRSSGDSEPTIRRISSRPGDAFRRRLIHARRPGRVQMNPLKRPHAICRHVHPSDKPLLGNNPRPQHFFQRRRHPRPRFSRPDNRNPPDAIQIDRRRIRIADCQPIRIDMHMFANQSLRSDRRQPGLPNLNRIGSQLRSGAGHGQYSSSRWEQPFSLAHAFRRGSRPSKKRLAPSGAKAA